MSIPHNSVDYPIDGRSNGSTQQIKKSWELQYDDSSYVDHLTAQTYVTYSPASAFDDESAYFETLSSFKEYVESANISYKADDIDDIISLENRLTNIRYELESYQSKEVGECGCEDQINYRQDLEHLLDLGIYNLMLDLQEINRKKAEIVWIRHEINKKNQQIVTIQKQIDELKESCKVTLTQLQEASDKSNHH